MYYNMFSNMEDELFRRQRAPSSRRRASLLADLLGQGSWTSPLPKLHRHGAELTRP